MKYGWNALMMLVGFSVLLHGCSHPSRLETVPDDVRTKAVLLDTPGIRYWCIQRPISQ